MSASTANVWVAGALSATPHSGLMPLVAFALTALHLWMGGLVGAARRKHRIPYPTLYAVPGTLRDYSPDREKLAAASASSSTASLAESGGGADSLSNVISEADAFAFNCIQRGHMNTLENMPSVVMLLLVTWPCFPLPSAICGFIWIAGRVLYMIGYSKGVAQRMWGAIAYVGFLGLLGLSLATAAFLYNRTSAY